MVLLLWPLWGVTAESRVLIIQEDTSVSRQTAELLQRDLTSSGWQVAVERFDRNAQAAARVDREQLLVALGPRAFSAALKTAGGRYVVGALISQNSVDEIESNVDRWSAILLDQPLERWGQLLQMTFPRIQDIGLVASGSWSKSIRGLERRSSERKLTLVVEQVQTEDEVIPAIDRLMPRVGLLWALPDPVVHNRNTVQPLLLTTYRAGIPVVAYSEAYLQAGAVLVLYSSYAQIAQQVRETLVGVREGKSVAGIQSPRYFTVGVNTMVARSLGLSLPAASELNTRLRSPTQ